jgi:hypothetical protein
VLLLTYHPEHATQAALVLALYFHMYSTMDIKEAMQVSGG